MFAEVFALTLIRSYDRAERVNKAMEARGFKGKYTAATHIPDIRPLEYRVHAGFSIADDLCIMVRKATPIEAY